MIWRPWGSPTRALRSFRAALSWGGESFLWWCEFSADEMLLNASLSSREGHDSPKSWGCTEEQQASLQVAGQWQT